MDILTAMDAQEERRGQLYDVLKELCADNIAYFAKDDTMNGSKIHAAFQTLSLHIDIAKKRIGKYSIGRIP